MLKFELAKGLDLKALGAVVIPVCFFKGNFVKLQESYENFGLISKC